MPASCRCPRCSPWTRRCCWPSASGQSDDTYRRCILSKPTPNPNPQLKPKHHLPLNPDKHTYTCICAHTRRSPRIPHTRLFDLCFYVCPCMHIRSGRVAQRQDSRYSNSVGRRVWSWGTVGIAVQFFNVYLTAVALKFQDKHWWPDGVATFK